jgi:hypothetical protein
MLDHRTAGDVRERFARETGRVKPRGDDGKDRRFSQRKREARDRNSRHGEFYHSGGTGMTRERDATRRGADEVLCSEFFVLSWRSSFIVLRS